MNAPLSALRKFVVQAKHARLRLDQFLAREIPDVSRMRVQALIRDRAVLLNGNTPRPRDIVKRGDRITVASLREESDAQPTPASGTTVPLAILHEDDDLIVLNKAAGVSVHPGAGHSTGTLVDALLAHSASLSAVGGEMRRGIVHRLDKETSGCLVVAKNDFTHLKLARQFAARSVEKIYLALVCGKPRRDSGTIDASITRHRVHRTKMAVAREGGRAARTDFRVVRSGAEASLIECRLHSGRTHQIRVHLQHLGHPVLGDKVYAGRRGGNFPRQMLHAWKLAFDHPRTDERVHFTAPFPEDFEAAMRAVL
ncbi:MAG: RluA family pseudouridine synthase [Verrucomicrobia bacterium]|nr:RluA family pseudouridine synthase [Verrucomicrobiota bacterium]